jgi:hypothetical protein
VFGAAWSLPSSSAPELLAENARRRNNSVPAILGVALEDGPRVAQGVQVRRPKHDAIAFGGDTDAKVHKRSGRPGRPLA